MFYGWYIAYFKKKIKEKNIKSVKFHFEKMFISSERSLLVIFQMFAIEMLRSHQILFIIS